MRNILRKEMKLSASPLSYFFILFGLMFFLPGYPILCGAFFVTLGIFQGFQSAREANDIVFSALLPIRKQDVVKGKYLFVCFIEACGLFNTVFLGGFFRTAYKLGKPFILYIAAGFPALAVFEALHHIPGLEAVNAFGFDHIGLQCVLFLAGLAAFLIMTLLSYRSACRHFEKIDL